MVVSPLTHEERERIVEQAVILLEQAYVHLPLKRAMHAVEPIQRLKLLGQRLKSLSEQAFHYELVTIFSCLRDRHTSYILPEPFRSSVAFLPFRIQEFFDADVPQYIVTHVSPTVKKPHFKRGVIVTHWNGVPIRKAIEINADREEGSNPEARFARGLEVMTIRPLGLSKPPDEEWVIISYKDGRQARQVRFDWEVLQLSKPVNAIDLLSPTSEQARVLGADTSADTKTEVERQVRRLLFLPESIALERAWQALKSQIPEDVSKLASKLPDVFQFRKVTTRYGTFGYIRIYTFNVPSDQAFVREFIRMAALLPQNALILDVRGNGGGNILAGERLLQVLTPKRIDPERFYFINSPLTLKLCQQEGCGFIHQWRDSIAQAVETGATFSQGFPLLSIESYNDIGQKYHGPIVLVTDALSYSTTDIFTAGFQDHAIGKILGIGNNTGAGGANVWDHSHFLQYLPGENSPFKPLPNNRLLPHCHSELYAGR